MRLLLVSLPMPMLMMIGLVLDNVPLMLAASAGVILSAFVAPQVGLMHLALLAPLLGRPIIPYPGVITVLATATIFGAVFRLPVDRPRLAISPIFVVAAAFVGYAFLQQVPAMLDGYVDAGLNVGSTFLRLLTGFLVILAAGLVLHGRSPRPYLAGVMISATFATAVVAVMYVNPASVTALGSLVLRPDWLLRPAGVFFDPNYYAMFAATVIVMAVAWVPSLTRRSQRLAIGAVVAFLVVGLAIAQSRSALAALMAGLVALAFLKSRLLGVVTAVVLAVVGAIMYVVLIDLRLTASGGGVTELGLLRNAESDSYRLSTVLEGPQLFATSPILGVGLGGYVEATGDASHNWYMSVLAEQGLVGVTLMGAFIVTVVRGLLRRSPRPKAVGLGVFSVLMVGGLFLEPLLEVQWVVPVAIILVAAFVADWGAADQPSGSDRPLGLSSA